MGEGERRVRCIVLVRRMWRLRGRGVLRVQVSVKEEWLVKEGLGGARETMVVPSQIQFRGCNGGACP